jgi:RecA-family ATPase
MAIPNGATAAELMQMEFGTQNFIIQSLLTEGPNLLGARKGEGKSFMALDMAIAVAQGSPLWGQFPAIAGDVLFLALEDTLERLKRRLKQRGGCFSDHITFITCEKDGTGWMRAAWPP